MQSNGVATAKEQDSVNLGVLSWELDFFGRLRSLKDTGLESVPGHRAGRGRRTDLPYGRRRPSLLPGHAADRENLRLAQETFETQKTYATWWPSSGTPGWPRTWTCARPRARADAARVDMARFQGLLALDLNALDLLAGTPVPEELLPKGLDATGGLKDVSAGLPPEVLLHRPDILVAEYQLKAANASIGAARAAFFPRVTLTAGVGNHGAVVLRTLHVRAPAPGASLRRSSLPSSPGGSLRAGLKVAKVDRDIAMAQYQKIHPGGLPGGGRRPGLRGSFTEQLDAQAACGRRWAMSALWPTALQGGSGWLPRGAGGATFPLMAPGRA